MQHARTALLLLAVATGLTWLFWGPLWTGGGLIGGDLYTYFLPQKLFFAERLQAGEFPLWNFWIGHGFPLVGESQTAPFYPFNLLFYGTLDLNAAFHASHLLHYFLCYVFTWLYARRLGLTVAGAHLASLVFVYGWFPARATLEWAVITGAYLPLALWCVESFLQTRLWRYGILLAVALGLQLLAGHYNVAFITQVVLVAYVPLRLWWARDGLPPETLATRLRCTGFLAAGLVCGFALAAVQLLPTWQLKQHSGRAETGVEYDPGYGHLPPASLSQVVTSWWWQQTGVDRNRLVNQADFLASSSPTNQVEAHVYFGLIPLALAVWTAARCWRFRTRDRRMLLWLVLGAAALVYATGWLIPVTRHLPGFGFFKGPGRWSIVITMGVGLLAGDGLGRLLARSLGWKCHSAIGLVFALTALDLLGIGRDAGDWTMLDHPPVKRRDRSLVSTLLQRKNGPVRLYAPGANLPTLLGVACTPPYLGLAPAEYRDPALTMPEAPAEDPADENGGEPRPAAPGQIDWLQRAGVTHVLSFRPLDPKDWPATLLWQGRDPFLNPAWARPYEPLFLYELEDDRGRASFVPPKSGESVDIADYRSRRIVLNVNSEEGGRVVLTDLMYPGWRVAVDGEEAEPIRFEGMYRAVDVPPGAHTVVWSCHSAPLYWGAAVSTVAILLLAAAAHVRYWHPRRLRFFEPSSRESSQS